MALTDSEGTSPFTMPVQPMYGGYGNNNGLFGGDGSWILLWLICMMCGGWGGFGMGGGMSRAGRMNAKRDSMGRYSRDGYSYADSIDGLIDEMRGMMGDLPEEKRREVERFVNKMDRM